MAAGGEAALRIIGADTARAPSLALLAKSDSRSPLHIAAASRNVGVFAALLDLDQSLDARDRHGRFPVHLAASVGSAAIVGIILERGGRQELSKVDVNGETPLHHAARKGQIGVTQLLLANGASSVVRADWRRLWRTPRGAANAAARRKRRKWMRASPTQGPLPGSIRRLHEISVLLLDEERRWRAVRDWDEPPK
jgi:hypothetical protein